MTISTPADVERLGNEIAELSAHLDAATARLLELIREFEARGGWNHGFRSCAHWLSWRISMELGAAREHVRVARALGSLPRLADALARGELSYSKVRALTRVATPETEERLIAVGKAGTACHVERIVRGWRRVDRLAEAREDARRQKARALHVYQNEDGMVVIRGRLTPEQGAVVSRRWPQPARRCTSGHAARTRQAGPKTFPQKRPRSNSSKRTRSLCSPRRPSITLSIPAHPASATRSSFTSTPRYWPMPRRRASPSSTAAHTFPLERPSAWLATRPE
jgi:hypothetical protein